MPWFENNRYGLSGKFVCVIILLNVVTLPTLSGLSVSSSDFFEPHPFIKMVYSAGK